LARATRLRTHLDADAHVLDTKQGLFEFLWSLAGDPCAAADRSAPELVGYPDDRRVDGSGPELYVTRAEDLRSL
jgi:hypothetical protein